MDRIGKNLYRGFFGKETGEAQRLAVEAPKLDGDVEIYFTHKKGEKEACLAVHGPVVTVHIFLGWILGSVSLKVTNGNKEAAMEFVRIAYETAVGMILHQEGGGQDGR